MEQKQEQTEKPDSKPVDPSVTKRQDEWKKFLDKYKDRVATLPVVDNKRVVPGAWDEKLGMWVWLDRAARRQSKRAFEKKTKNRSNK